MQIQRNEALLFLIRARLHLLAGRREDRLVFDLQTAVANPLATARKRPRASASLRASETLMRRYYWAPRRCRS